MNTYETAAEAAADRADQLRLVAALNASDLSLRRDECGAWRISGTRGCIYTWGDGKTWVLAVWCRSHRLWTATKGHLAFCEVTSDGDDDGCLRLHSLPTKEQAAEIRRCLGIRKRQELSLEALEFRRLAMAHVRELAN